MWERRDGGYFVVADEMVKTAINFNEQCDRRQAECARRGEHLPAVKDDADDDAVDEPKTAEGSTVLVPFPRCWEAVGSPLRVLRCAESPRMVGRFGRID